MSPPPGSLIENMYGNTNLECKYLCIVRWFFMINQLNDLFFYFLSLITERALEENTSRQVRNSNTITIQQGPSLRHDPGDLVVIYNRVPKTGSTSFTGIAYDLCSTNKYNVIHINTTRNTHTMSIADQVSSFLCVRTKDVKKENLSFTPFCHYMHVLILLCGNDTVITIYFVWDGFGSTCNWPPYVIFKRLAV